MNELCDVRLLRTFCHEAATNDLTKRVVRARLYALLMQSISVEDADFSMSASEFDKMSSFCMLPDTMVTQTDSRGSALSVYSFVTLVNTLRRRLRSSTSTASGSSKSTSPPGSVH